MISINLLPDVKKNLLRVRRERNLVVTVSIVAVAASVGVLFLLGAMLAGATIIKNGHIGKIDDYESEIEEAKDKDQLNEYLTVQNQLSQIDGLKGEQKVYSRLMDYLVQLNPAAPNNAALKSVSLEDGDEGIAITLEGTTANYATLNVYKNTLINAILKYEEKTDDESSDEQSDDESDTANDEKAERINLFSSVTVRDSNFVDEGNNGNSVRFEITAVFDPKAFDSSIENQSIEIPEEVVSDGDQNAPKSPDEQEAEQKETFHTDESTQQDSEEVNNE